MNKKMKELYEMLGELKGLIFSIDIIQKLENINSIEELKTFTKNQRNLWVSKNNELAEAICNKNCEIATDIVELEKKNET